MSESGKFSTQMHLDTKPQLQPVDMVIGAKACHEEGLVLLAEAREHLSVVMCRAVDFPDGDSLSLIDCRWLLYGPRSIGLLPVDEIVVEWSWQGYWRAYRKNDDCIVRWPSRRPYFVQFLEPAMLNALDEDISSLRVSKALKKIVAGFVCVPGFRVNEMGRLSAPPDYACVPDNGSIKDNIIPIPTEFCVE